MSKWLLIVGFLVSLLVLTYGTFVREQPEFEEDRLRHPFAPFPTKRYEFEDYPRWTELALLDRFGYRDVLLKSNRWIHQRVFGESDSLFAWVGEDDWLFINVGDPNRGHDDKPTLDARLTEWAEAYAERAAWCKANGMEYVLLLAPEKSSVYPEYLTEQQRRRLPEVEVNPRLKQMLEARGVRCVQPLDAMLEAKKNGLIYHRNDTHWNQTGAFIAHQALMKELNVVPSAGYYTIEERDYIGDLNRLTGTSKTCLAPYYTHPTHTPVWNLDHPSRELLVKRSMIKHLQPKVSVHPQASGPGIVFLHDSFGEAMFDFLSHDCRSVATATTDDFEKAYILAHKPAVVVQEIVSRKLYRWAPNQPPAKLPSD
jgi:alginate O-acetyltransferase complex protein AlgJ